jgi:hypothetical protein
MLYPVELRARGLSIWVDVAGVTLGCNAEREIGPSLMKGLTVNGNLVANDRIRPDTSRLKQYAELEVILTLPAGVAAINP